MDVLTAWQKIGATAVGSFHLRDYDLTQPDTPPEATEATKLATSGAGGAGRVRMAGAGPYPDAMRPRGHG